jgi:toxin YoeB
MCKGDRLVMYQLVYTSIARKDAKKIAQSNLKDQCVKILKILEIDPYKTPPPYKRLIGDLDGYISRRVNIQHRLVYKVYEAEKVVKIIRMWSHYG